MTIDEKLKILTENRELIEIMCNAKLFPVVDNDMVSPDYEPEKIVGVQNEH